MHAPGLSAVLSSALTDTDVTIRTAAVTAVGNLRDRAAFAALTARLKDGDTGVKIAAITALSKLPEPKVIPLLLPLLKTGDAMAIRLAAAGGLGRLRASQAIPALLSLIAAVDRNTVDCTPYNKNDVNNSLARALQRIGDPTMRAALATFRACATPPADDRHAQQNQLALQAWMDVLGDGWCQSREMKQALVGVSAVEKYAHLTNQLFYSQRNWRLIEPVAGVMDNLYFEPIAIYMPTPQREKWMNARHDYGARQPAGAIDNYIAGLKDSNPDIRRKNVTALGELGDRRGVPPLLELLQQDTDAGVREYVALALGEIGDERAVMPLCARVETDTTEWSRSAAAWALGQLGDPRATDTLATAMPGQNPRFQVRASRSLLQLGDARGGETLAALVNDPDEMTSELACLGFSALHTPQPTAIPVLLERLKKSTDKDTQLMLLRALAAVADATTAAPMWEFLQTHDDPQTSAQAARALANAADPAMADALYQVAQDALDDESRTAAALGLLKLHDPRAADLLIDLAQAPFGNGRNSAVYALSALDDPRVTDTCAMLLEDDDPLTRALAARVLMLRKDSRGVPALLALLAEGADSRIAAARFLGEGKVRSAVAPLCTALKTATPAERAAFADTLGTLGDPAAIPALTACRQDTISRVSQAAVKALNKLGVAG